MEELLPEDILVLILGGLPQPSPRDASRWQAARVSRRWRLACRRLDYQVHAALRTAHTEEELLQLAAWARCHRLRGLVLAGRPQAAGGRPVPLAFTPLGAAGQLVSLEVRTRLATDWASLRACARLTRLVLEAPPALVPPLDPGPAGAEPLQRALASTFAALRALGEGLLPLRQLVCLDLAGLLDVYPAPFGAVEWATYLEFGRAVAWLGRLTQLQGLRTSLGTWAAFRLPRLDYLLINRPLLRLAVPGLGLSCRLTCLALSLVTLAGPLAGLPPSLLRLCLYDCSKGDGAPGYLAPLAALPRLTFLAWSGGRDLLRGGAVLRDAEEMLTAPDSGLGALLGLKVLKMEDVVDAAFLSRHAPGLLHLEELHLGLPSSAEAGALHAWRDQAHLAALGGLPRLRHVLFDVHRVAEEWDLPPETQALLQQRGCRWQVTRASDGLLYH